MDNYDKILVKKKSKQYHIYMYKLQLTERTKAFTSNCIWLVWIILREEDAKDSTITIQACTRTYYSLLYVWGKVSSREYIGNYVNVWLGWIVSYTKNPSSMMRQDWWFQFL